MPSIMRLVRVEVTSGGKYEPRSSADIIGTNHVGGGCDTHLQCYLGWLQCFVQTF
jgi:hypothetical protein